MVALAIEENTRKKDNGHAGIIKSFFFWGVN